ncbi:P-type conjugative transfer ATPase TrbB [Cardiobacterium hominis]|jgi:P-type conjugative transfer ATPase trbB|uniref:P-type conjugative transfer ATPase TrbB n=1 Tax=Cardiobacterium hominis TaxID=2718 RepID=UPI0028E6F3F1|nr:P-type conjugative transfer ATPase TrbB [Cardiobacterium hominis]
MLENEEYQRRLHSKITRELGREVMTALQDDTVIEVMLNTDGRLWCDRLGEGMSCIGEMSMPNALALLGTIADGLGTVITKQSPILEGELPLDGSRFEGLIPPVVARPTFTIRKKALLIYTLDDYVQQGIMNAKQKAQIQEAITARRNILVVGGTGSGKTTLTNAIIAEMVALTPEDRLVIMEDTAEIQCKADNAVILRTSIDISMQQLLRATMRLRPDRIIVGEVRGAEALALLKSWNTGHPGGIATLHANSADSGLVRLEQLIAESGIQADMKALIDEAVDLVIFIEKQGGKRVIKEIKKFF